jgi:hypothetical protein
MWSRGMLIGYYWESQKERDQKVGGRPRTGWVDNIKIDLREAGIVYLAQGPVKDSCEHGNEPSG